MLFRDGCITPPSNTLNLAVIRDFQGIGLDFQGV